MKKFACYIDYLSGNAKPYEYVELKASDELNAICECEQYYNPNTVYLVRLMKKMGKAEKIGLNTYREMYTAVACKRSWLIGWHKNDTEHSEQEHNTEHIYIKTKTGNVGYYETI